MLSNLILGRQVIPLDVEKFNPENYEQVGRNEIAWVKRKEELPPLHLAHETIKNHIMQSGTYSLSPFSFNWNQHSRIYSIIGIFKRWSNHVVLSSCRVDAIARDPGLVQLITQFGATNLTCAIEGISTGICNFLQKSLMPEELYNGMYHIVNQPFNAIKVYLIYTGLEGDADIVEFDKHLRELDEIRRRAGKPMLEMRMSFTPLLSTLGTPLQYHGSKISRSLKAGSSALWKIKHLAARYGFGIRLSSSIASSDFSQTVEFLDRRGQPLLEYLSLCGAYSMPKYSLSFYEDSEPCTRTEWEAIPASERLMVDGEYHKIKVRDRISIDKIYNYMNSMDLFPHFTIERLCEILREYEGRVLPDEVLDRMPRRRRDAMSKLKLKLTEDMGNDYVTDAPNGRPYYRMMVNIKVNDIAADLIKDWIPLFTGGVTFNDIVQDKDALYIFPSLHIKFHQNRHMGQDFRQYVANRAFLFDSYCFNDALSKSLVGETKIRIRIRKAKAGESKTNYRAYSEIDPMHAEQVPMSIGPDIANLKS